MTLADKIKENRFKILIMCYLSFAIISNTVTTGAFEVYFDDTLVFSKIRKYRYPTTEVIFLLSLVISRTFSVYWWSMSRSVSSVLLFFVDCLFSWFCFLQ